MRANVRERSGMIRLPAFCLLALLFAASLAAAAHPGYFPDAVEAYDRGGYKTAYGIWKELADQGDAHAQNRLGNMYAEGKGVPQDLILAHMWFTLAVSRFPESEAKAREKALKNRDIVASRMTPAQISDAQRRAREWKPKKEAK